MPDGAYNRSHFVGMHLRIRTTSKVEYTFLCEFYKFIMQGNAQRALKMSTIEETQMLTKKKTSFERR